MNYHLLVFVATLLYVALSSGSPVVIGHRGASGYRPENTLASWDLAIQFGADYVEADLVPTKDHVLVASHNPDITHTTDVADHKEFASRYTTMNISGEIFEGYFIHDFTVTELKSLRTRERYPFRTQAWNGLYPVATLQEYLTFIRAKSIELNKKIGVYLETKHPSFYRSTGLPLEELLVQTLHDNGYTSESDMVYIESFESNLKHLRTLTKLPLVQLVSGTEGDKAQFDTQRRWKDLTTPEGLMEIASYAQVVAPHKSVILRPNSSGVPTPTSFIKDAHSAGLGIHVWSFRKEREHFEKHEDKLFGTVEEEIRAFFDLNVDGIFADQPDIGVQIKNDMSSIANDISHFITVLISIIAAASLYKMSRSLRANERTEDVMIKTKKQEYSNSY